MSSRRDFIAATVAGSIPCFWYGPVFGQSQNKASAQVLWGGLGYSVAQSDVTNRFPLISKAVDQIGWNNLVSAFTNSLQKNYPGGFAEDPVKLLSSKDDPGLLFTICLDYEQIITVPEGNQIAQNSYIYAQAQVLFLEMPRDGGTDGSIRVVYSFPFRSQAAEAYEKDKPVPQTEIFKNLLLTRDKSVVNVFSKYVASKRFKEGSYPLILKVSSVTIRPEAAGVFKNLGISESLQPSFFGQAFTASLAEQGQLSVMPFVANNTIRELSARFNQYPKIEKIFEKFRNNSELDYAVDLTIHAAFRESNGGNQGNVLYARGISVFVKVTSINDSKKVVFDKKILLIENSELPRLMMDNLKDYDLRYFVQIVIKLYDDFVSAVMNENSAGLKSVGLDPSKDIGEVKALKQLWQKCRVLSA
jgi:hypothetical protein